MCWAERDTWSEDEELEELSSAVLEFGVLELGEDEDTRLSNDDSGEINEVVVVDDNCSEDMFGWCWPQFSVALSCTIVDGDI
jgi:hypothetical protein